MFKRGRSSQRSTSTNRSRAISKSPARTGLSDTQKRSVVRIAKKVADKGITGYIVNVNAGTNLNQSVTAPANYTALLNPASPGAVQADLALTMGAPSSNFATCSAMPRAGDVMKMKKIHIKGFVFPTSSLPIDDFVRIILYVDKNSKANQPNVNQVVDGNDSTWSVYNNVNVDFKNRFRILADKLLHVVNKQTTAYSAGVLVTTGNSSPNTKVSFEIIANLNYLADYSRNTLGTYADMDSGALCLGLVTNASDSHQYTLVYGYNLEYEHHNEKREIL